MQYKNIFRQVMTLISSPAKAWEEISRMEDRQSVFVEFVYPMIGLCGLSVFLGSLFTFGWSGPESFQVAMTQCCAVAVAQFGGYFLSSYILNRIYVKWYGLPDNLPLVQQFAGYALVVSFLVQIVNGILPDFRVIGWILQFYMVYVVWEGAPVLLKVREKSLLSFTLLTSFILFVCPVVIQLIFNKLATSLN